MVLSVLCCVLDEVKKVLHLWSALFTMCFVSQTCKCTNGFPSPTRTNQLFLNCMGWKDFSFSCISVFTPWGINIYTCTREWTNANRRTNACTHTHARAPARTHTHTYTHTRARAHTHTHLHVHRPHPLLPPLPTSPPLTRPFPRVPLPTHDTHL